MATKPVYSLREKQMNIDFLLRLFKPLDESRPSELLDIQESDFTLNLIIGNASANSVTLRGLQDFFGRTPLKIEPVPETQNLQIIISKIKVPDGYKHFDYLKAIEKIQGKNWFLGIGEYGAVNFNPDRLIHMGIYGKSGYGKSSFVKSIIGQTLNRRTDIDHIMIDPKGTELSVFKNHPNVIKTAVSKDEIDSVILSLLIEMGVREYYFKNSFENPPTGLLEYRELRKSHKAKLPEFKPIIIWVDEAHVYFDANHSATSREKAFEALFLKGRSYGVHFILSTQHPASITSLIKNQLNQVMTFHIDSRGWFYERDMKDIDCSELPAIPGRLQVIDRINNEVFQVQTPYMTSEQAQMMAYSKIKEGDKKSTFFPIKLKEEVFGEDFNLIDYLAHNHKIEDLSNFERAKKASTSMRTRVVNFIYKDEYTQGSTTTLTSESEELTVLDIKPRKEENTILPTLKKINNKMDLSISIEAYKESKKTSKSNFKDFLRHLENNSGVFQVFNYFYGGEIAGNSNLTLLQLALDEASQLKLFRYIEESTFALQRNIKPPLMIISAREGMGKMTIASALSNQLKVLQRNGTQKDLTGLPDGIFDGEAGGEKTETEMVVFKNLDQAMFYYRNCPQNKLVVCLNTPPEPRQGIFGFMSMEQPEINLDLVDDYLIHLELPKSFYKSEAVASKLLASLLAKAGYKGKEMAISEFIKAGVEITPERLNALVKQAESRAKHQKTSLKEEYLLEQLQEFKAKHKPRSNLVEIVEPTKGLQDLIVNDRVRAEIEELIFRAKNLSKPKYKFAQRLRKGGRCSALFGGAAGAGKSLAGEVIAKELGKQLWRVNFASLSSKFVGETEKQITEVFQNCQLAGEVLLIDEADAIFGSREASDNDYSRKIANHLLNEMENYQGIVITTTNLTDSLDKAFNRRFDFKVKFEAPKKNEQIKILKALLEPDAPVPKDLDYDLLMEGITMSGGLIRNAVERAIFQMEKNELEIMSFDLLRKSLKDTQEASSVMETERKKIGINPE